MNAPIIMDKEAMLADLAAPAILSGRRTGRVVWLLFFALFALAAFAPISSGVVAPGQLISSTSRQLIQHPTGGVVAEILVDDGQQVAEGDVLIRLSGVEESATAGIAQAEVFALRVEEAVRTEELNDQANPEWSASLEEAARANPERSAVLASQRDAYEARLARTAAATRQIDARRGQLQQSIAAVNARLGAAQKQLDLVTEEVTGIRSLLEKGLATRDRVLALERTAADLAGAEAAFEADIRRYRQEEAELVSRRQQILLDARAEAAEALQVARTKLAEAGYKAASAQDSLARTELRAPLSGAIMGLRVKTVGGVIAPGEPVMEILPVGSELLVASRVRLQDADDVREGMKATVSFDPLSVDDAPRIRGSVVYVSPDAVRDERTGEQYFEARVDIPVDQARRLPPRVLAPGLPAEVLIHAGSRSVLAYMFAPIDQTAFKALREP